MEAIPTQPCAPKLNTNGAPVKPTWPVPKSNAGGRGNGVPLDPNANSYAPRSTAPLQVAWLPGRMRPLPSRSRSGKMDDWKPNGVNGIFVPPSMTGEED